MRFEGQGRRCTNVPSMGNGRTVQRVLLQARNIHLATYNRAAGDVEQGCYAVRAESFARGAIQQGQKPGIMVQRSGSQGITERRTGGGSLGMQRELIARLLSKRKHQDPTRPLDLSEGGGRIMNLEGNKTLSVGMTRLWQQSRGACAIHDWTENSGWTDGPLEQLSS